MFKSGFESGLWMGAAEGVFDEPPPPPTVVLPSVQLPEVSDTANAWKTLKNHARIYIMYIHEL